MSGRLDEDNESLENSEMRLEEEELRILSLLKNFKKMEQNCKVLRAKTDLLHKFTGRVIGNASAEHQMGLTSVDGVLPQVEI